MQHGTVGMFQESLAIDLLRLPNVSGLLVLLGEL
jgi:hypothetical protein